MDVLVKAAVTAVHVLVETDRARAVVKGRAEGGQLSGTEHGVLFHRPDSGHSHSFIPGGARLFPGAIEPLGGRLVLEVGQGSTGIDGGESHADAQWLSRFQFAEIEPAAQVAAGHFGEAMGLIESAIEPVVGERLSLLAPVIDERTVKAQGEVDEPGSAPAGGLPVADHGAVVLHAQEGPDVFVGVVVDVVGQVHGQMGGPPSRKVYRCWPVRARR